MNSQVALAGRVGPATLNLAPEAFTSALVAITGTDKLGWPADDHINLVLTLLARLKDEEGKPATLTESQQDCLRLIYRPLEDTQRKVLKQVFAEAGYKLSPAAEDTFVMMFSAGQFASFLAKMENPATKKPFIVIEKTKGAKKKTLASLISNAHPTPNKPATGEKPAEGTSTPDAITPPSTEQKS